MRQFLDHLAGCLRRVIANNVRRLFGRGHERFNFALEFLGNCAAVAVDGGLQGGEVVGLFLNGFVQFGGMGRQVLTRLPQGFGLLFQPILHLVCDIVRIPGNRLEQVNLSGQLGRHSLDTVQRGVRRNPQVLRLSLKRVTGARGGLFGFGLSRVQQFQPGPDFVDLRVNGLRRLGKFVLNFGNRLRQVLAEPFTGLAHVIHGVIHAVDHAVNPTLSACQLVALNAQRGGNRRRLLIHPQ